MLDAGVEVVVLEEGPDDRTLGAEAEEVVHLEELVEGKTRSLLEQA
jgi:hypothetical protein